MKQLESVWVSKEYAATTTLPAIVDELRRPGARYSVHKCDGGPGCPPAGLAVIHLLIEGIA